MGGTDASRARLTPPLRSHALGAALGVAADALIGEPPPSLPHPVSAFGSLMRSVERGLYRDSRVAGALHASTGVLVGALTGLAVPSTALATYVAVAQRELCRAALEVEGALARGSVEEARSLLPALVGRDPSTLDATEISRAAVESVAENSVDAVVAPALWAAAGGSSGALAYRAVNTLDAMVGHRNERYLRFGWASARTDDVANFVPARVTAGLVSLVRPRAARSVWRAVRDQAPAHPSPNAGVAEAAFAAALGIRLGGTNRYGERVEERPVLGTGRVPETADIGRAVVLSRQVTYALAGLLAAVGIGVRVRPGCRA